MEQSIFSHRTIHHDKELAEVIVEQSGYTLDELKEDYVEGGSISYKRGYWAAHGINYSYGHLIEKLLF